MQPALLSSVKPAESSRVSFGNMALHSSLPGPPISVIPLAWSALRVVLSIHDDIPQLANFAFPCRNAD